MSALDTTSGSYVPGDDSTPPTDWGSGYLTDAQDQQRMGQGYPDNGQTWDVNAAMLGVSRLIDTAGRTYATVKGSMAATYAGQNGQTYTNGTRPAGAALSGGIVPLLLIGLVVFALVK